MLSNGARHVLKAQSAREFGFRSFSSYYAGGGSSWSGGTSKDEAASIRAYPQYSVFGERCVLALKMLPPTLQLLKSRTLIVEKKGRMLLEWNPRAPDGSVLRDNQVRFGLSPEEVGLILDQLPQHQVELTRQPPRNFNEFAAVSQPKASKVLTLTPQGSGGVITFKVQFEDDGSSFIEPRTDGSSGALEVAVQLGEFQVMRQLMLSSIPVLVGWQQQVDIALERSIDSARRNQGQPMAHSSSSAGHDVSF